MIAGRFVSVTPSGFRTIVPCALCRLAFTYRKLIILRVNSTGVPPEGRVGTAGIDM